MASTSSSRTIELGGGRRLVIRPVEPDDVDGLDDLYQDLDLEDRHSRFFSAYHPSRRFLERMTSVADRGGVELVAVIHHDADRDAEGDDEGGAPGGEGPPARIVAEAGFERLGNGDGELGITVARSWRGWLGPYLLDVLLDAAAEGGVPNLEAEVLVTNTSMLALGHARGAVDLAQPDWTLVRLLIGTSAGQPTWPPDDDRARVLVEGGGGGWNARRDEGTSGVVVLACPGPGRSHTECPAMRGHPCPLAAEADAIVMPDDGTEPWRSLAAAHGDLHPGVPVCIAPHGGRPPSVGDVVAIAQRHHRHHRGRSGHV